MKKHLLSVLLVICMVIVLAPSVLAAANVAKVNGTEHPTIEEAIQEANPGDTVILLTDVPNLPQIDKAITIDGNGHHVTAKADECQFGVIDGTVTLKNLVFDNGTEAIRTDYGNYGDATNDYENLNLVIDGCTFNNLTGYAIMGGQAEKKTLKSLTVTGCTFNAGTECDNFMVYAQQVGTLKVTNCIFNGNGVTKGAIHTGDSTKIATVAQISGGSITGVERGVQTANRVDGSSVSVSDVAFKGVTAAAGEKTGAIYVYNYATAPVSATNNTFTECTNVVSTNNTTEGFVSTIVTTFTGNTADNKELVLNADGTVTESTTTSSYVATMNDKPYSSLQAAIDEATKTAGSYEIVLASGTNDEDIIIHQTEGVNITVKGNGEDTVFSGYIEVYGHCRNTGAETLTFDGVVFSTSETSHVFIEQTCMTATNESADKCYPHNITVQNCSFTATGNALNTAVGMKFRYGYNIKVTETTGTGLHSLMQNYAGQGLIIEDVTITGGKNGIALGTSQNVSVSDLTVEAIGYGLRVDAENATTITVEDSDIEAFIPVVVRNAKANVDLVFNGKNTMTETNTDGIWCAIGATEYETNGKMPTAPTSGTINVKLNDIGLDADGVYGEKELLLPEIISYDITFDANGGDCATETLTTDSDGKLSELPVATRTGYTFNGWYNGTEKVDTDTVYTQNTTLTAKWTASKYTVTLVTNGGTIRSGNVTEYTYGVGAVLPTNVTRSGYTFDGWYDNEACKGSPVTEIKTTDIENKTFYAKWTYIYLPVIPSTPTYPPVVDSGNNGNVVITPKNPQKGDTVIITPNPDEGFEVDEIIVTDKNGNSVAVVDNGNGTYSFKQPSGKVNIEVTFKEIKIDTTCHGGWTCPMHDYTDLNTTAWYHDGIHFCIENGLMGSTSNEKLTFAPDLSTTRAMIVTILWRLEGEPIVNYAMTFEDVADGMWYTEAIRWAQSTGVVEGYSAEKFGPNDTITREQMATIMWRYAKDNGYDVSVGENTNILSYDDAFDVADWAMPAMQWSCGAGLIKGIESGNTMELEPQGNATRAQVATILQRFYENVVES